MTDQNILFSKFLKVSGVLFSKLLDRDDMLSLYGAKKIVRSTNIVHRNLTYYLSENNAANVIFISVNLGIIVYQYIYASWFMYMTTTISGLKKLLNLIFKNPISGIFFYLSFYFKMLSTSDKEKFDVIAKVLNLPKHSDMASVDFLNKLITNLSEKLLDHDLWGYKNVLKDLMIMTSSIVTSMVIENVPITVLKVLEKVPVKQITKMSNKVFYISRNDVILQSELDEWMEYVLQNKEKIKNGIKVIRKKKNKMKLELKKIVEKTKDGKVICLDECKSRTKTYMGCYCEGDCGSTFFIGGQSWCYVDPRKCKKGKYLPKYLGYAYDKCDKTNIDKPNCYTGYNYRKCQEK